jgi:DNA-binding response OmpR family regulator
MNEDKVDGLDMDDYRVNPFGIAELLARLRAWLRQAPQVQAAQWLMGPLVLDDGRLFPRVISS